MRMVVVMVVALAVVTAGGCMSMTEQKRLEKEEKISATRLSGKFRHDDPLVAMLGPSERDALDRAGMLEPMTEEELAEADALAEGKDPNGEEEKSFQDQAGEVLMSVLSVSVTLGMMAAPYLLF